MVLLISNMAYTQTITLTLETDSLYKITGPAGLDAYYSGVKVLGSGANNYFFANGTTNLELESVTQITSTISVIKILPSYYDTYDSQGGVWAYQPDIDKWVTKYSFRPEWLCLVGNRLVSFKAGYPYIHDSTVYNTFYGQAYDSAIGFIHNEAGNVTKKYNSLSIEGDTPSIVHARTEVPYVQSSDLRSTEFTIKEGVNYSPIYRDRLSPNVTGTYDQKLYKGDIVRGETAKFQVVFSTPTTPKVLKFVNIDFDPSSGHTTQNTQ